MRPLYGLLALVIAIGAVAFGAPFLMLVPLAIVLAPMNAPQALARDPETSPHRWRPRSRADLSRVDAVR